MRSWAVRASARASAAVRRGAENPLVEPISLTYSEALSQLVGMLDEQVDLSVRGANRSPPLTLSIDGKLGRGGDVYGGEIVGYHAEALRLFVGELMLTLHPDHFVDARWTEERFRQLTLVMGALEITIRTGPETGE